MVPPAGTTVRADRLRALNVPRPVIVVCDENGTPVAIEDGAGEQGSKGVREIMEIWVVHDEWWRPPGINRRYVEVLLEGGAHLILFEDLNTGTWLVQQP